MISVCPNVCCGLPENTDAHIPYLLDDGILRFRKSVGGESLILKYRVLLSKDVEEPKLPRPSIAVAEKGVLSILGKTLFTLVA